MEELVRAHVYLRDVVRVQAAPSATVPQHYSHQPQSGGELYLSSAMRAVQEKRAEPVVVLSLSGSEMHEGRNAWLAYGEAVDSGIRCEGGDRLKVGRFVLAAVARDLLSTDVLTVFVAVGGVVLGDLVDVGEHGFIWGMGPA